MLRAAQLLEERANAFAEVLIDEIGSPVMKARFEIQYAIGHLRTASGLPRRACGQTLPSDSPGRFGMSVREPLGVFACITPFNVPLIKAMKQCTGPLATGNTVVMLASEEAPVLGAKVAVTEAGGVVFPPMPAFYLGLQSLDEAATQLVGRILDQFGVHLPVVKRWTGTRPPGDPPISRR